MWQAGPRPKDHELRELPAPKSVMQLLVDRQTEAVEGCPYVFVPPRRWRFIQRFRSEGRWRHGQALLNDLNRRLAVLRRRANVAHFTLHDLRRTCITN